MGRAPFVAMMTDLRKDDRVEVIAEMTGFDRDAVLGKLFRLWAWCTDRGLEDAPEDCDGYAVPERVIRQFLGEGGVAAILGDGCDELALGVRRADGLIYLRGTHETVSRLRGLRATAVAGGEGAHASNKRNGAGRFVRNQQIVQPTVQPDSSRIPADGPAELQLDASREPAASSDLPQTTDLPECVSPRARAIPLSTAPSAEPRIEYDATPAHPPEPAAITPASRERADRRRRLVVEAWALAGREFQQLKSEGIDPDAVNAWAGLPDAGSPPMKRLFAHVDRLLVGDPPDYDAAWTVIARRVAVAATEARAQHGHLRYMTPMRMWDENSFEIGSELTPAQVARARQRPESRAGPKPRDQTKGPVTPKKPSEYKAGVQKL